LQGADLIERGSESVKDYRPEDADGDCVVIQAEDEDEAKAICKADGLTLMGLIYAKFEELEGAEEVLEALAESIVSTKH
jgi:hypothetical protein